MSEVAGITASLERRLPLGIPGLDEIFMGGLIPRRCYLLAGQPGAGKTIFAFQWLREMQRQGLRTQYISLAEAGGEVRRNMAAFGWDLAGIELRDLHIGPGGFSVGGKMDHLHGVQTGVPLWQPAAQCAE